MRIVYSPLDAVAIARRHPERRSSSSRWVSRPLRRPTRWPSTRPTRRASPISRCWCRTCSCRRPWRRSSPRRQSRAGLPRRRSRVHGDGLHRVRADRAQVSRADRGHRLRAAGHAPGRLSVRQAAGRGTGRGREPVRARGAAAKGTRTPRISCARCSASSRASGAASARSLGAAWRCRSASRSFDAETRFGVAGARRGGADRVHQRADPPGAEEAARVPRVRHPLHSRTPARRDDGVVGRRVRGVLPVPPHPDSRAGPWQSEPDDAAGFSCPVPIAQYPRVLLAHGGGGQLMHQLIEKMFVPAFGNRGSTRGTTARSSRRAPAAWRSRPIPTSCGRCSFPAATSARWPSTAR